MKLVHKFINDLEMIEESQLFCNEKISVKSNILIIGTFNPSETSCIKKNQACWFYGRKENLFWKYLPLSLASDSLHSSENKDRKDWEQFCVKNKIVIVDLIKEIKTNIILENFKDISIDNRINQHFDNVSIFNFEKAFKNISFDKVIYSRKGWGNDIKKLKEIKSKVNDILLKLKIIDDISQIKYCPAPWQKRKTTFTQWRYAINNKEIE